MSKTLQHICVVITHYLIFFKHKNFIRTNIRKYFKLKLRTLFIPTLKKLHSAPACCFWTGVFCLNMSHFVALSNVYRLVYVCSSQSRGKFVQAVRTLNISESLVIRFVKRKVVTLHLIKVQM
jgi:hypothetical protein